ncbi:glycosyltransferase family 2 protein [Siccirubricoccus phaeus]|uniref:glycosyltransferase family 2 protein n=1 Tax=Siccirubricoccus phaeus TaxID=2595053 RepID=UPI001A9C8873|nr:glycosyltransferase family 2 protein [Siccirubricoccus phaeus]
MDSLISFIIPVLDEEEAIPHFLRAVDLAFAGTGQRLELLFVDDGSTDGTLTLLAGLAAADPRIRVLSFSRNFGKEAALTAGLAHARGDAAVPVDVDLQDPLELVPRFVEQWRLGYDVVYGVRADRRSDNPLKRHSARLFYRFFNLLSDTRLPQDTGDFRLLDRRVVAALAQLPERERFMKGLFAWIGFRAIGLPFERPARVAGRTKWRPWKLWNFALQGVTSFSTVPLRVWTYVGAVIALFAFLYAAFIVLRTLVLGIDLPGYPSLMAVVLFLSGVQILSLGIIGEYLGRLFKEAKQRPLYIIAEEYPPPAVPDAPRLAAGVPQPWT